MEETQLLIFRSGSEKYGIPIEDVSGIIANAGVNGLSMVGELERAVDTQSGEKKSAIIAHMNGVQILIIVDEIIQERKLVSREAESDATITSLQIWNCT